MKAIYYSSYGGPEVLQYGETDAPVINKNKIVVQVKAVSINPLDYKIRSGGLKWLSGSKFPKIPGADFSGIVKEVGENVNIFKPGDRVYGYIPILFGKNGALSELVMVSPKQIRYMPENMSFEEAAAIPVAALTALNGLSKSGNLQGKSVLINGATGGVGHFALQIASARGAVVTAVCSTPNIDLARQLGADQIIDYSKEDIAKQGKQYDVIFDAYGKMKYKTICDLLRRKGVYSSTLLMPPAMVSAFFIRLFFNKKLTAASMLARPEDYSEIEKLYNDLKVKPFVENIFTLENSKDAFLLMETGKPRGKVIIRVS